MSEVVSATSFDLRFNADNIFDSSLSTFWITTGLYPQELMIDLKAPHNLNELKIKSMRGILWLLVWTNFKLKLHSYVYLIILDFIIRLIYYAFSYLFLIVGSTFIFFWLKKITVFIVKKMIIEGCANSEASDFFKVGEKGKKNIK